MKKTFLILLLFGLWVMVIPIQAQYRTEALADPIHTLQVRVAGEWDALPVIALDSDEQIEISFDVFASEAESYTYKVTHCNADWKPSLLLQSEYMSGFQYLFLEDYAYSFNTKRDYVNYRLFFPNDDVQLKVSGNYLVQVFRSGEAEPLLNACFSVIESVVEIDLEVSSVTDKGANTFFQEVSFDLRYGNEVKSPMQELKVFVRQNNRYDNEAALVTPMNIQNKQLSYQHHPDLIFEAGNEYRMFEMISSKSLGYNVDMIDYRAPYYYAFLRPEPIRSDRFYSFYEDINGRIFIRSDEAEDADVEADYHFVHFFLPMDKPLNESIFILSEAFNNQLNERSLMSYDDQQRGYTKVVPMKEGYYNYQYVTAPLGSRKGSPALTEGNFYQTENEYAVWVYFRPQGDRYDRLIGIQSIHFK